MKVIPPSEDGIALAAAALKAGKVIAYPTETVYGLGVDPHNEQALDALFQGKERLASKAVLLIIDDIGQLDGLVKSVSPAARQYIERFWPGPLSLLLPAVSGLPAHLTGPEGKLCVRRPSCETARALCRAFGGAVTSTSANVSGKAPARSVTDITLSAVDLALDGGLLPESLPSTIFDPDSRRVLREGAIPAAALHNLQ